MRFSSQKRVAGAFALGLLFAGQPGRAMADTVCYIYVQGDCHGWIPANAWFPDDYHGASSDNGVCLHRARDFATWCGLQNAGDQVNAAFNLDSVTISAQVYKPGFDFGNVGPTVSTYGINWAPLVVTPTEAPPVTSQSLTSIGAPDIWSLKP